MPIDVQHSPDACGAYYEAHGVVTLRDFSDAQAQAAADPERLARLRYVLVDFADYERLEVTPRDIRLVVEQMARDALVVSDVFVAIAAQQALPYALSRMLALLSHFSNVELRVFRSRADAVAELRRQVLARSIETDVAAFLASCTRGDPGLEDTG